MGLLDRVAEAKHTLSFGGGQGFVEPPFWSLDNLGSPWVYSGGAPEREKVENDFEGYVAGAYKADGIVFACILTRQLIFSEARFQWREFRNGRPGNLFGSPELELLEKPWPNGTTGELLTRMEGDLSLAGNFYATTADDRGRLGRASAGGPDRRISRLRPDWVTIVVGSRSGDPRAADARPIAYVYEPPPTGLGDKADPVILMPDEVCHYSLLPDPVASFRGMSWLTPVLREIQADRAATVHKSKFFENGATINHAVSIDKDTSPEWFREFVAEFKKHHEGLDNAYKTVFLGGGADVTAIGTDFRQLDFKATQGAGETRIAAASGVGAVVAQFSEGMQGSSLNAGNYAAARRRVGDALFRPLWRTASAALQSLVTPPRDGVSLWYDDRDIAFLREDRGDIADIQNKQAQTIRQLVDAGYEPTSVIEAVNAEDWSRLKHSGLYSVQLQPPTTSTQPPAVPSLNGNGRALEGV